MSADTTPTDTSSTTTDADQEFVTDDVAVEIRYDHSEQQSLVLADHLKTSASVLVTVDQHVEPAEAGELLDKAQQAVSNEVREYGGER